MAQTTTSDALTRIESIATDVHARHHDGGRIIDFDVDANNDYEVQSCVVTDENGRVVEAAVRFGRVEERPELYIKRAILQNAWQGMVSIAAGDVEAVEADLSDFGCLVPHLRVNCESVEEYDAETVTIDEFASIVAELAELTETVLRGDDDTIDREIDTYL